MASIIKPDSPSKAEKKPLVEEINRTQKSDPSINTDKLPDDHPIHLFPEAKEFYRDSRPPFVLNKHAKVTRTVVVPTQDGLRPQFPKKVEVIAKPWDKKTMFGPWI